MIRFRKSDYIPSIEAIGKGFSFPTGALRARLPPQKIRTGKLIAPRATALLLLAFAGIFLFLPLPSEARDALFVDRDTVIQANFLGINGVYHGFTYLPESVEMGMTAELRALELARVKESGIRIARTFYRPDWAMGEGPWVRPDWNSIKMKGLYAWLSDMQKIGIDVGLNMGWWFPRDVIWNQDQHFAVYPDDLKNYCAWLSESLHQMIQIRGFTNVKYIFMFTEPETPYGSAPRNKATWDFYKEVLQSANQRLIDDGRRSLVKIVGPNTAQAPTWLDKAALELNDVIDIYASHNYNFTSYQGWYDMALSVQSAVAATGKPFWIDEYGIQDAALRQSGRYGTALALANAAFLNVGAQASFLWILNDQYYPFPLKHYTSRDSFLDGKHSWGLFPWLPESKSVRPAGEAFVLLAHFMGQAGAKVLQTKGSAEVAVAAIEQAAGGCNVLLVNGGKESKEVALDFSRQDERPLYRYSFRPAGSPLVEANRRAIEVQGGGSIHDALGAGEVVIYSNDLPRGGTRELPVDKEAGGEVFVRPTPESWRTPADKLDNLAFQKRGGASSFDPEWPVANLTDGKRLTTWRSAATLRAQPEQVTIDLGQDFQVQRLEIFPGYGGADKKGSISPKSLAVSVSVDNKQWRQVPFQDKQRQATEALTYAFKAQTARYVRIVSQGERRSKEDRLFQVSLGEVKVFGR